MANPFPTKFNSECQLCGDYVEQGEFMFSIPDPDGDPEVRYFVCRGCARSGAHVCTCGKYKKEEFDVCYDCFQKELLK
jgi:hypothetical protein